LLTATTYKRADWRPGDPIRTSGEHWILYIGTVAEAMYILHAFCRSPARYRSASSIWQNVAGAAAARASVKEEEMAAPIRRSRPALDAVGFPPTAA
jgi:hypothetical protein